ncbi:MAG: type II toxin-antitoxin system MqsA family antitoxin [Bacteroidota bacterium]
MSNTSCPLCGGVKKSATTTFTVDYTSGVVVVRNVPASVCSQCGEEWIPDDIAEKLESIVESARIGQMQVEVVNFAYTVAA